MVGKLNEPSQYVDQERQIKKGRSYCGAACAAMITGEPPQDVADEIGSTADDMKIINYIERNGYETRKIVDGGSAQTRWSFAPSDDDFDKVRDAIDAGLVVLYHFAGWDKLSTGHYALCVGYDTFGFTFYDPAGDRFKGYFNRHGKGAVYTIEQLRKAGIKRLFSVEV